MPTLTPEARVTATGLVLALVPERGTYRALRCTWLVRVPSGDEAPPCEADRWRIENCEARTFAHPDVEGGTLCENGHERLPFEVAMAREAEREQIERAQGGGW